MEEQNTVTIKLVPCEVYSRIVGYMRPIQSWNKGKQQEFNERRYFDYEQMFKEEKRGSK